MRKCNAFFSTITTLTLPQLEQTKTSSKKPPMITQTEKELNDAILKITMLIQEKYPELSKYIVEMPVTIPTELHPIINSKSLQDYYNSLCELVENYSDNLSHSKTNT